MIQFQEIHQEHASIRFYQSVHPRVCSFSIGHKQTLKSDPYQYHKTLIVIIISVFYTKSNPQLLSLTLNGDLNLNQVYTEKFQTVFISKHLSKIHLSEKIIKEYTPFDLIGHGTSNSLCVRNILLFEVDPGMISLQNSIKVFNSNFMLGNSSDLNI